MRHHASAVSASDADGHPDRAIGAAQRLPLEL
jgi:hypothetical protein